MSGWLTSTAAANSLFEAVPLSTRLTLVEPLALTWTTPPFTADLDVIGPASLELHVATLLPQADLYAAGADVWPDGAAHAVGVG